MRKFLIFCLVNLSFIGTLSAQTKVERQKAIAIIENIMYYEFYLGTKCYEKTEIKYYDTEGRIEINKTNYIDENSNYKYKYSFYLSDLDLTSLVYDLYEYEPGLYFFSVQIKSKPKSIEKNQISIHKKDFPYPTSKNEYLDKLEISCSKAIPENMALRLMENLKILFGAKNYRKLDLLKK